MANKFWVGGGTNSNWNSSPTTNWANTSGGAGNQTAPATGDSVFFDNNSGTGTVVWNTTVSMATINCTGSRNQITHNTSVTITISSGDFILPDGSGSAYSPATTGSTIQFTGTSGTQKLTSNGKNISNIVQNGSGGTVQLQDNLNCTAVQGGGYTLTAGTFDAQAFTVAVTIFAGSGSTARTITGSGDWSVTNTQGTVTPWNFATVTNLTISGFTSTVTFGGAFAGQFIHTIAFGTTTYAASFAFTSSGGGGYLTTGSPTIAGLSVSTTSQLEIALTAGTTITVTGTIAINGNKTNQLFFTSSNLGAQASLSKSSGSPSFSWAGLRAIACSGGATFTATNSYDLGFNTGVTITPPYMYPRSGLQAIDEGIFP